MDHAAALIDAFVLRSRHERYLALLRSARGRAKLRGALAHFGDLDPRYATRLSGAQDARAVAALLAARGAPATCYALSEDSALDDRDLPLEEALAAVVGRGMGT